MGRLKCHQYWPDDLGDTLELDSVLTNVLKNLIFIMFAQGITVTMYECDTAGVNRTSQLEILRNGESRHVSHVQFLAW